METFEERARILLRAMLDMMDSQESYCHVREVFELTAIWDGTECDGGCWQQEAIELLEDNTYPSKIEQIEYFLDEYIPISTNDKYLVEEIRKVLM